MSTESTEIDNLIIEHLKALRNDLRDLKLLNTEEHNDIKARISHLDSVVLGMKRNELENSSEVARQQVSIDQIVQRIEKIERRLEIAS
jgi:hypothetical protein